jgi:hypothetical protein
MTLLYDAIASSLLLLKQGLVQFVDFGHVPVKCVLFKLQGTRYLWADPSSDDKMPDTPERIV